MLRWRPASSLEPHHHLLDVHTSAAMSRVHVPLFRSRDSWCEGGCEGQGKFRLGFLHAHAHQQQGDSGGSSMSFRGEDVHFVHKGGTVPTSPAPTLEGTLLKRGGSHGGRANWKSRACKLVDQTLYYCESSKSRSAKGFVNLQGLTVTITAPPDDKVGPVLCLRAGDDDGPAFYMQVRGATHARRRLIAAHARTLPFRRVRRHRARNCKPCGWRRCALRAVLPAWSLRRPMEPRCRSRVRRRRSGALCPTVGV